MNQLLAWLHSHAHHPVQAAPIPGAFTPPVFPIPPANDHPYINGMKDPVEGGFVTLEEAEKLRAHCLASHDPKLVAFAQTVLPFKFAVEAAATIPEFAMSEWDAKSCNFNCQAAYDFFEMLAPGQGLDTKSWCPAAGFVARAPVEGSGKLYSQGPGLYGYSAFGPSVTPEQLPEIFGNILAHL